MLRPDGNWGLDAAGGRYGKKGQLLRVDSEEKSEVMTQIASKYIKYTLLLWWKYTLKI